VLKYANRKTSGVPTMKNKIVLVLLSLCMSSFLGCGFFDTGANRNGISTSNNNNNGNGNSSTLCSGITCPTGEVCNAATGACISISSDLCQHITCESPGLCDPTTGQCAYPLSVSGVGSCTAGQTISTSFIALGLSLDTGNQQSVISGIIWSSSAGIINGNTGVVTCPSVTGPFTITAHKSGYIDGTKIITVNSVAFTLQRITNPISATIDCIGGGNGNNGTASVKFKAFYGSTDVTSLATWTGTGILTADPSTKGSINCGNTTNNSQTQTGTFTVQYSGATTSGLLKVEDCGAMGQSNCL